MKEISEIPVCFIDFETTGSNLFTDDPIQIGAVLYDWSDSIPIEFQSFIKPSKEARNTQKAFNIHQLRISDLKDKPTPKIVLSDFFQKFGTEFCFAGWNISFDVPFFKKLCYENGFQKIYDKLNYRHIDVQSICRVLKYLELVNPELNSLTDFANYFNLKRSSSHDALEDAKITFKVFLNAIDQLDESISVQRKFDRHI